MRATCVNFHGQHSSPAQRGDHTPRGRRRPTVDPIVIGRPTHATPDFDPDVHPILLGSPHYAPVCTRPAVYTVLRILGSAQASPMEAHWRALQKVLRYLHGTIHMRLTLGGGLDHILQFTGFADADMLTKILPGPALARHRSAILGGQDPMQRFIP
jgi:hypothetical protein